MKRRILGVVALFGLVAGVVVASTVGGGQPGGPEVDAADEATEASKSLPGSAPEADDGPAAMELALELGVPVEDVSQREPAHEVFAQPDGMWLARDWMSPVWVDQAPPGASSPTWVLLDTDLAAAAEGRLAPTAVPGDLSFAAGGEVSDLARWEIPESGVTVSLVSPVPVLPEPVIEGSRLRYVEIVPGADLVVDVLPTGFEQYWVLHDRNTLVALDGAVSNTYRVDGGSARLSGNSVEVVDAGGEVVASIPQPLAWDATSDRSLINPVLSTWIRADVTPADETHLDEVPELSPASIELESSGSEYTVTTVVDREWADSDERVFPLVIDPALWNPGMAGDTYVQTYHTEVNYGSSGDLFLGRVPGGSTVYRPYFAVDAATLRSKDLDLNSAVLVLWNYWSATCTPQWYHAYWTYAPNGATTWKNQPSYRSGLAMSSSETMGHTSSTKPYCSQGWSGIDILPLARMWQTDTQSYEGIQLNTGDETLTARWKRFYSTESSSPYKPHIDYVYNQKPNAPTGLVYTPPTSNTQGILKATVSDPDGGSVRAAFTVERRPIGSTSAWETMVAKQEGSLVTSGGVSSRSIDLIAGFEYRFSAYGYDGRVFSTNATASITFINPATGVFNDLPATNDSQASAVRFSSINVLSARDVTTVGAAR